MNNLSQHPEQYAELIKTLEKELQKESIREKQSR